MEPITCTRASIERARTKPFTVPFDFAFWDMQPQLLQRAFVERPCAFAKWARKQARATTRAKISERETRLKKRAMKVLMEMAELQLEAGNQVVIAAAAAGAIQQAGPSGEQDDAEAEEAAKLSTEQKEALMQAIDSQTPEQVEEASQFLARAARAMAASPGEAVNVFDYLDDEDAPEVDVFDYLEENSPLADEQMRELAGKLASAETSFSDGTSPHHFRRTGPGFGDSALRGSSRSQ